MPILLSAGVVHIPDLFEGLVAWSDREFNARGNARFSYSRELEFSMGEQLELEI